VEVCREVSRRRWSVVAVEVVSGLAECELEKTIARGPLLFRDFRGLRPMAPGPVSFDDR
jgi:hypothetical protein